MLIKVAQACPTWVSALLRFPSWYPAVYRLCVVTWQAWLCNRYVSVSGFVRCDVAPEALAARCQCLSVSDRATWDRGHVLSNTLWAKPDLTEPDADFLFLNLYYRWATFRNLSRWSKTATTPPTTSRRKPVAVSRGARCAARRKGSASSGCGVTAGECLCPPRTYRRCCCVEVSSTACFLTRGYYATHARDGGGVAC